MIDLSKQLNMVLQFFQMGIDLIIWLKLSSPLPFKFTELGPKGKPKMHM